MPALALTDHNGVAGAVKFAAACRAYHVKSQSSGAELTVLDTDEPAGPTSHLTIIAESAEGYANLNRLLSLAHDHGGRRTPALFAPALRSSAGERSGWIAVSDRLPPRPPFLPGPGAPLRRRPAGRT